MERDWLPKSLSGTCPTFAMLAHNTDRFAARSACLKDSMDGMRQLNSRHCGRIESLPTRA